MFRPNKVILRPSKKTDPGIVYVSLHCGIPNAYKFLLEKCKMHKLVYVELCDGFDIMVVKGVPIATEIRISLIILPLMRILQRNLKRTTDTFLFISHTTIVLLFKFRCNIFIGVRIIKEMPVSLACGTHCILKSLCIKCIEIGLKLVKLKVVN